MNREDINFILQKTDLKELKSLYEKINEFHEIKILQKPTQQTLLQPVIDPISSGEFYAGEVLVTTTIVQVGTDSANKGWAMVQDDNEEISLYISACDGAYGADFFKSEIENLVTKTIQNIEKTQKELNKKINSTKVSFDLMTQG
jgi:alpha-D-ribose 1-methylphosphonate 5-triphosphate synthase subunit PhnG